MREILFRGKEKDQWVSGYYWKYEQNGKEFHVIRDSADKLLKFNHICAPETLGQYTGLTDKNGVKIFEGDIVHLYGDKGTDTRFVNYIALVVFAHGGFCAIDGTPDDYAVCRFDFTSTLNCEIIGNIYDNPGLIEEDNK